MKPITPPELAALIDVSERQRAGDWSLRAALCRYAQPQPVRVSALLDLVRRIESALGDHLAVIKKRGDDVWAAHLAAGVTADADIAPILPLLGLLTVIDALGDTIAGWAVARDGERPDAAVDAAIETLTRSADEIGLPLQERPGPPRGRG